MKKARGGLFLDRDGTLIDHIPYLHDPAQVRLLPEVRTALISALEKEFHLFLFTNQSGVGRGWFTMNEVEACNKRMFQLLDLPAPGFTEICVAPEAPGVEGGYRKPNPGFILEMIEKYSLDSSSCLMLGDREVDLETANNAGIEGMLVTPESGVARQFSLFSEQGRKADHIR